MKNKIIVLGSDGQLGTALCDLFENKNIDLKEFDFPDIDIRISETYQNKIIDYNPDILINCAAYTNVEGAEDEEALAFNVNYAGVMNLAEYAKERDITLCHLSTDYVFDGTKEEPYTEEDPTNPLGVYGKSKWAGEEEVRTVEKHYIIRTAWMYGRYGKNFISKIIAASKINDELKVVNDQYGSPTYTVDLSKRIMEIVTHLPYGTYNATNNGVCTWYELACYVLKSLKINTPVVPISSSDYPSRVKRPSYSVLSNESSLKCGLKPMPNWQDAVDRFLQYLDE